MLAMTTHCNQSVFLCEAGCCNFNDLKKLDKDFPTIMERIKYGGVCDMHAWVRAFEALCHVSDKKPFEKTRVPKKDPVRVSREKNRQDRF